MKTFITCLFIININIALVRSQSSMVFETNTTIEVTGSADICADVITINGSYSGDGTQCNAPLPVELLTFTASVEENRILLRWQTATEVNNYGFKIERNANLRSLSNLEGFENIGFVEGHGNSNSPKEYSFVDKTFLSGKYFYRLKQIDNDGKYEYSETIEVDLGMPKEFSLSQNFPNPFNPITTINFALPEASKVSLKVYSVIGDEVAELINEEKPAGFHHVDFNASELSSGIYFYEIIIGKFRSIRKMLLIK